jgi:hypothetical protein
MKISWPFFVFPCRFAARKNNGVQGVETLPATSPRPHCDDIATTGHAETLQATSLQNTINRLNNKQNENETIINFYLCYVCGESFRAGNYWSA